MTVERNGVIECDVAIIGGGPGGSTVGTMLKKYNPALRVVIFEKEKFPRDHIGESQLPPISDVLDEMGCWDKVEAADFPIKVGATFKWGAKKELWDFEFLPLKDFKREPRPAKYVGQRRQTAFQVDRSKYDTILLRHAAECGCEVHEETQVASIRNEGDRVNGLVLRDGQQVTARYYIDASGHAGIMRRALGVQTDVPTQLMNIAIWDYWENADWAIEIGVGGTRIQVMSVGFGWMWFIPLGPTRTSLGLVCPAKYYKESKKKPEELYYEALRSEPRISALVAKGKARGRIETTTDWSFLAERTVGENWFLVGESAGFADPILSAGLTLAHTGARECAYTIMELDRRAHDPAWMKQQYDHNQRSRVRQHIRFADFWYAANSQFTDLKEHCAQIAKDAGLRLAPQAAWRWLAQGGFSNDVIGQAGIGGFDLAGAKQLSQIFLDRPSGWQLNEVNVLKLDLTGAKERPIATYEGGRIIATPCWHRGARRLAVTGMFKTVMESLKRFSNIGDIYNDLQATFGQLLSAQHARVAMQHAVQTLEIMLNDGWVTGKMDKKKARLMLDTPEVGGLVHPSIDPIGTKK